MENNKKNFQEIQNLLKEQGFIFQGSQIYGGLSNTWDYGPAGSLMIDNIKKAWKQEFVTSEMNVYNLDSKILLNPNVWKASGHIDSFSDPLIENLNNGKRYRADKIIEEDNSTINAEAMSYQEMEKYLHNHIKKYDDAETKWGTIKEFNLLFETKQGVVENKKSTIYLRPETAQGIFVNFKNVQRATRAKVPFGIAQIGKSFRNEVTPGNYIFRTREFEQMELEYFVKPNTDEEAFRSYVQKSFNFIKKMGISENSIKLREHQEDELAHYAKATTDIEFMFPFGWGELMGIANRSDYDLKQHQKASGENLEYFDPIDNSRYFPFVIEPSLGVDRLMLALLVDAYEIEEVSENQRVVMRLDKDIAPYQFAVLPLVKKYHDKLAKEIAQKLKLMGFNILYDEAGSIGKRYRRQDALGTPFSITISDETVNSNKVTVRHRDSMEQDEVLVDDLKKYFK